jgi:guanidinopropionase
VFATQTVNVGTAAPDGSHGNYRFERLASRDIFDPGFAAVAKAQFTTPEVGGLTPWEVLELLRGLRGIDFVGGDVVEAAPQCDPTSNTKHIAAQVLFTILCLMV